MVLREAVVLAVDLEECVQDNVVVVVAVQDPVAE